MKINNNFTLFANFAFSSSIIASLRGILNKSGVILITSLNSDKMNIMLLEYLHEK